MHSRRLAHYELLEVIGEGGMGLVYKARDGILKRTVALKVLGSSVRHDAERQARFRREAQTAALINHPNVATIFEFGQAPMAAGETPILFLAMEYVQGKDLHQRYMRRAPEPKEMIHVASQIAAGLDAAHAVGVIHRDLKPGNIKITPEGKVKILDFGLAKLQESGSLFEAIPEDQAFKTREGLVMGTAPYVAPELFRGQEADARTDLFALGVVLYQVLTGRLPFPAPTVAEYLHQLAHNEPDPVRDLAPDTPPELERIVLRLLAKDPDRRYQSASALQHDLESLGTDLSSDSSPHAATRALTQPSKPLPFSRRPRRLIVPTLIVLLAVVGLTAALLTSFNRPAVRDRLAILRFANLTGQAERQYLAEGISSFLIVQLSELPDVTVLSQQQTWPYDQGGSLDRMAREVGVSRLLEGSLQRQDDRLQVGVWLTDAASGEVVWSRTYRGNEGELFSLQSEIAIDVATELGASGSPRVMERLANDASRTQAAFLPFLEGLPLLRDGGPQDIRVAASLFQRAVEADPDFAYAQWGLGEALHRVYLQDRSGALQQRAEAAARRALELDPALSLARATLAAILRSNGRTAEAIDLLERAPDLVPSSTLYDQLVAAYAELGDDRHSNELLQRALEFRPATEVYRELARAYEAVGDVERAEETHRRAIEVDPESWLSRHDRAVFYLQQGRYGEARRDVEAARQLAPEEALPIETLAVLALVDGEFGDAIRLLEGLDRADLGAAAASNLGTAYFYLGDYAGAAANYDLALREEPSNFTLQANLGDAYRAMGQQAAAAVSYEEAIRLIEEQLDTFPGRSELELQRARYQAKAGQCAAALDYVDAKRQRAGDWMQLRGIAGIEALCDRPDAAIRTLDAALSRGYTVELMSSEAEFADLRGTPGYRALLEQHHPTP